MSSIGGTIDPGEIGRFAAQAQSWWDPEGSFRALHRVNPARLGFIRQYLTAHFGRDPSSLRPFDGLSLLDIGERGAAEFLNYAFHASLDRLSAAGKPARAGFAAAACPYCRAGGTTP